MKLENLLLVVDENKVQCYGETDSIMKMGDLEDRLKNLGWKDNMFKGAPAFQCAKTQKGDGIPRMEKSPEEWHYKKIQTEEELNKFSAPPLMLCEIRDSMGEQVVIKIPNGNQFLVNVSSECEKSHNV